MLRVTLAPEAPGWASLDVEVEHDSAATVGDLADSLTQLLGPAPASAHGGLSEGWAPRLADTIPAASLGFGELAIRSGAILHVVPAPAGWRSTTAFARNPVATMHITAGADVGREIPLMRADVVIGRDPVCEVVLDDPLVSREHVRVRIAELPEIADLGSVNGTQVNGVSIAVPTRVGWRQPVAIGDSEVYFEKTEHSPLKSGTVPVLRPPRVDPIFRPRELQIGPEPERPRTPEVPWASMLIAVLMGVVLYAVTRSAYSFVFSALSPLFFLGSYLEGRRSTRKHFEYQMARHEALLARRLEQLAVDQAGEIAYLAREFPDSRRFLQWATGRDVRLWARRPTDADFLAVRVGTGTRASATTLTVGGEDGVPETEAVNDKVAPHATITSVPAVVSLSEVGSMAVVGGPDAVSAAARSVLLQIAVAHSPVDVGIVAVLGALRDRLLSELTWLPHVTGPFSALAHPLGRDAAEGQAVLDELLEHAAEAGSDSRGPVVVVIDEDADIPRRLVDRLVGAGTEGGLHVVWVGASPASVPKGMGCVVDLAGGDGICRVKYGDRRAPVVLDTVDVLADTEFETGSRTLAACVDVTVDLPQDLSLPGEARLTEVVGEMRGPDDDTTIIERWAQSRGLRASVGVSTEGPFTLDMRMDGPHCLVAGTTGAGKSELLQTMIAALAINTPPSRLTFLLVDYKGGAAFKDCGRLPHTVGYITDLTPALVQRALTSMNAEIHRRERILNAFAAKDLIELEHTHPAECPPSLLICVDEFAALTADAPEFVAGMVNIAQRGRSLGVHMVLATQRPAGVVTDNIRANIGLRIALRVADAGESVDVIDTPDAFKIPRSAPGRACVRRVGHGDPVLIQTAFVGARRLADEIVPAVRIRPFHPRPGGGAAPGGGHSADAQDRRSAPTDLSRVVAAVERARAVTGSDPGPPPWLLELSSDVRLNWGEDGYLRLGGTVAHSVEGMQVHVTDSVVPVGLLDEPEAQRQIPAMMDLATRGSYFVFGTSGSGKTELLRTVALNLSTQGAATTPHLYVLDFAGRGLRDLLDLPNVGAHIANEESERLFRFIRWLETEARRRVRVLADAGCADIDSYRAQSADPLARIVVLVDNYNAFTSEMDGLGIRGRRHQDRLGELIQNGRRLGIHFVLSALQRTNIDTSTLNAVQGRVVMRLGNPDEYSFFDISPTSIDKDDPPGRAVFDGVAAQMARLFAGGEQITAARAAVATRLQTPPHEVRILPVAVMPNELPPGRPDAVPIGLEHDQLDIATVELARGGFLIAGRSRSGRTSVLGGIATAVRAAAPHKRLVLLGPEATSCEGPWDAVCVDTGAAGDMLEQITAGQADEEVVLCIDDLHAWDVDPYDSGTESQFRADLVRFLKGIDYRRTWLIATTDTDAARSAYSDSALSELRKSRFGLLLRADGADSSVLAVDLPNDYDGREIPARGFLCVDGTFQLVQAASTGAVVAGSSDSGWNP